MFTKTDKITLHTDKNCMHVQTISLIKANSNQVCKVRKKQGYVILGTARGIKIMQIVLLKYINTIIM